MYQNNQIELSVIIINWNTAGLLDTCLASIYKHTHDLHFEIIVSDNASDDHLKEVLKKYPGVRSIFNLENIGFARANNQAVKQAKGKYLLLLNPDTEIGENILLKVLHFIRNNKYHVIGVRLRLPDGRIQVSSGNFPGIRTMIIQNCYLFLNKIKLAFIIPFISTISKVSISQLIRNETLWNPYENHRVDWVSGAFFLIAKSDFIKAGKFREAYFFSAEEIDLCYRLAREGKQAFFYGMTEIIHHSGASLKQFSQRSFILHHLAGLRLYVMNRPKWEILAYRSILITAFLLSSLLLKLKTLFTKNSRKAELRSRIHAYQELINLYLGNQDESMYCR